MAGGFITLHRQILDWEWYKNTNVKVLFLHLLLKANYRDLSFEGHRILRGQLVTSLPSLAVETGLSVKQIRGSLEHLISTGEVTSKSYPRYRVITIVKYDDYQVDDRLMGSQTAGEWAAKGQPKGSQTAGKGQAEGRQRAASKQYNNTNNDNNGTMEQEREGTAKRFTPPTYDEILSFCHDNNIWIEISRFMDYYASKGWKVGNSPMKDWKAAVRNWARRDGGASPAQAPAPRPARPSSAHNFTEREEEYDAFSDPVGSVAADIKRAREAGEL